MKIRGIEISSDRQFRELPALRVDVEGLTPARIWLDLETGFPVRIDRPDRNDPSLTDTTFPSPTSKWFLWNSLAGHHHWLFPLYLTGRTIKVEEWTTFELAESEFQAKARMDGPKTILEVKYDVEVDPRLPRETRNFTLHYGNHALPQSVSGTTYDYGSLANPRTTGNGSVKWNSTFQAKPEVGPVAFGEDPRLDAPSFPFSFGRALATAREHPEYANFRQAHPDHYVSFAAFLPTGAEESGLPEWDLRFLSSSGKGLTPEHSTIDFVVRGTKVNGHDTAAVVLHGNLFGGVNVQYTPEHLGKQGRADLVPIISPFLSPLVKIRDCRLVEMGISETVGTPAEAVFGVRPTDGSSFKSRTYSAVNGQLLHESRPAEEPWT